MPPFKKWSRHSPRSYSAPNIQEERWRNQEEEDRRRQSELHKKSEAGKVIVQEARANGVPLVVKWAGPREDVYLAGVDAEGHVLVATPGFDKEPRVLHPSDIDHDPKAWTLENATPEVQAAWDRLQGPEMEEHKKRSHEYYLEQTAKNEEERRRKDDRFRSSD